MATKQDRERREIRYTNSQKIAKAQNDAQASGGCLKIPEGMKLYDLGKAGLKEWNIIPFVVGKNAKVIHRDCNPGDVHYELTYLQHRGVGPEEKTVVCLRTFREKCPLCERYAAFRKENDMRDDDNKKTADSMKAKYRTVFILEDANDKKPEMELFEYSSHGFAVQLNEMLDHPKANERGWNNFFHLKGGMTVEAKMEPSDVSKDWLQCSTVTFNPRTKDLPESLLDDAPCLDEMLIRLTYDQMVKLADGNIERTDDNDNDRPSRGRDDDRPNNRNGHTRSRHDDDDDDDRPSRRRNDDDDDDDDDNQAARKDIDIGTYVMFDDERCKVVKVNSAGTRCDLEIERNGKLLRAIDVSECKVGVPVDDDDDKPARGRGRSARDDDDDDRPQRRASKDDDDDDDERGYKKGDDDDKPKDEPEPQKRGPGRPRKK